MATVNAADFNNLSTRYNNVKNSVKFPDSTGLALGSTATVTKGAKILKVSPTELRRAINVMESKFSNNCNCLTNPNCCQSCQTQTQCSYTCQSLSCQTQTCQGQSCQSQTQCSCEKCVRCQRYDCGNSH